MTDHDNPLPLRRIAVREDILRDIARIHKAILDGTDTIGILLEVLADLEVAHAALMADIDQAMDTMEGA